jgi:hypothetical protein
VNAPAMTTTALRRKWGRRDRRYSLASAHDDTAVWAVRQWRMAECVEYGMPDTMLKQAANWVMPKGRRPGTPLRSD